MKTSPESTAREVLSLAGSELLVNFRFLDRALFALELRESTDVSLMTDGRAIYYDPWFVAKRWSDDRNSVTRSYLHMILHLVLRHGFVGREADSTLWSLAADVACEYVIDEMDHGFLRTYSSGEHGKYYKMIRDGMSGDSPMTAELIYDALERAELPENELEAMRLSFWGDSHALWYGENSGIFSPDADVENLWEDISKRIQVELEILDPDKANALKSQLKLKNRAKQNYDEILRRFAVNREILKVSEEEFDNNYYTYGLELYGNVPIVEPLEYSEGRRIRDFVIAIDTSGSVKRELAERFIAHTYRILSDEEMFGHDARVHIIQADDRVRDDRVITNTAELGDYLNGLEIYGRGETDFRPVFEYVDRLRKSGELKDLRGLIYFTDGEGIFQESACDYDCCFVIHQDRIYSPVMVPGWVIRVELEEEDIINDRFQS